MTKKTILALATTASLIFSNEALADKSYDERVYIAPSVSYLWLDDDRLTSRSGHGFSLGFGKAINANTNLEVKALYNRYQHQSHDRNKYQWDSYGATFDVQYYFSREQIAPYAVVAAGFMNSEVGDSDAVGIIGEAGLGLAYKLSNNLSLRSDVRYRYNNNFNKVLTSGNRDRFNDLVVNVGFVIPLGEEPKAPAPKPEKRPEPAPAPINPDLDGDGVNNEYDECPNTPQGSVVNKKGCKIERTTLKGVNFKSASATLTNEATVALDALANKLNEYPKKDSIQIQGHTDSTGSEKFNLTLSQKRADNVASYLKEKNVTNEIKAVGYGESRPIANNNTKEGRETNRRVDLFWQ